MARLVRRLILLVGVGWCVSGLSGCATHAKQVRSLRDAYYSGNVDRAISIADKELERTKPDSDVLKLDRALLKLAAGSAKGAEQELRLVRDRFEELEGKDLGETALSYLADDNRQAYAGEDYEKILIRCFLALSNLMGDGSDATAYAIQVTQKQQQLIEAKGLDESKNLKLKYPKVALGAYLNAALQEATHLNYDDAARSIQLVVNWEPSFKAGKTDLDRATTGHHSASGNGVLYVFTLIGRGPYKEEKAEQPTSTALLIADRILSVTGKHSLPPTIAPIKVPVITSPHNRIRAVKVAIDGEGRGQTETITDIGRLAREQYQLIFPEIMARAVVRRVVKKGLIYATKEAASVQHPLAELALDGVGVAWEATEKADTRCWALLPDKIQVLRIELPVGEHSIGLTASDEKISLGPTSTTKFKIGDGRNTYVLATYPDSKLVGRMLVSGQAESENSTEID